MEIFLCRHGETDHNSSSIVQGHMEVELNEKGSSQAVKLADKLARLEPDYLYSSPLLRTMQTSKEISDQTGLEIREESLLKEVDQGDFEGETVQVMIEAMNNAESENHEWAPKNGESMEEARERAARFLQKLKEKHQNQTVAAVAHGGFKSVMILEALGHNSKNFNKIAQDNCCINVIKLDSEHGTVVQKVNDTSHLEEKN
ncbi:hypothetical protein GLU64_01690 [Nanohaloarchaea archaeon]|nr:hypothetical protein [Candidatus Nanohaloarchaea archaeon]